MKISSCLLAGGFIFASIYSMIISKYNKKTINFIGTLDSVEQLEMYNRVQSERLIIYLQGQILGMTLGVIYLFYFKNNSRYSYCYFSLITYIITIIYYLLKPKQYKMNDYLMILFFIGLIYMIAEHNSKEINCHKTKRIRRNSL